jgi:hypothetical protein
MEKIDMTDPKIDTAEQVKHQEMMKHGKGVPIRVTGDSGKTNPGEVRVQYWSLRERRLRALQYLGIFWGLSLATVLIPLAHFVLVPSLFFAGPIVAWIVYQQESVILGGESTCPECGAFLPLARKPNQWPFSDLCAKCYRNVQVSQLSAEDGHLIGQLK